MIDFIVRLSFNSPHECFCQTTSTSKSIPIALSGRFTKVSTIGLNRVLAGFSEPQTLQNRGLPPIRNTKSKQFFSVLKKNSAFRVSRTKSIET